MSYNETKAVEDLREFFTRHEDARRHVQKILREILNLARNAREFENPTLVFEAVDENELALRRLRL
jgi:hypothetical protein